VCVHHLSAAQLTRNWYDAKLHHNTLSVRAKEKR